MSILLRVLAWLSPLLFFPAAPALARDEALLPTGKWVVDFAAAQCLASRAYSTPEGPVTVLLKPSPVGNVVQLALITSGRRSEPKQLTGKIFVDAREPIDASLLLYNLSGAEKQIVNVANLSQDSFAPLRQAARVRMELQSGLDVSLALTQMKQVTDALDTCIADLQNVWNVGDTRTQALREPARTTKPIFELFSTNDYLTVALKQAQGGATSFVLLVDEKGTLTDCTIDSTSGVPSLDAQTCNILRSRGTFISAVGPDGQPAKGTIVGRLRWVIPPN